MVNKLVVDALKPVGIPVSFQKYTGNADRYVTFHEYFSDGKGFCDDTETESSHYMQIDIWSKNDYTGLVDDIRKSLTNNGFTRLDESDLYERDTDIYHKAMRFHFLEQRDGE